MDLRSGKKSRQGLYYNPRYTGSYSGVSSFKLPKSSKIKTERYLTTQDTYTLFKPVIRKFKRRKVICRIKYHTLEIDLVDMVALSRQNKGVKYLLTCIDCYSRFAFVRLLKNKKSSTVVKALASILDYTKNKTRLISADQGGEFINKEMSNFLDKRNITLYNSKNKTIKGSLIERYNRTLQNRLYRYMYANKTMTYIPIVQDIVDSYNSTTHRTLGMAPKTITNNDSEKLWNRLYPYRERKPPKFKIGQTVLIPVKTKLFRKGYVQTWDNSVYTIVDILNTNPWTYKLVNSNGNSVRKRFYEQEMNRVNY